MTSLDNSSSFSQRIYDLPLSTLKKWRTLSFFGFVLLEIVLMYLYNLSQYPASIFESQLSFSGAVLKTHYQVLVVHGTLVYYEVLQALDYVYMLNYGVLLFSLTVMAWKSIPRDRVFAFKLGKTMVFCSILAPLFDVVENFFIFLTLAHPLTFADWLAIAHSFCALIKWILIFVVVCWYIIMLPVRYFVYSRSSS